MELNGLPTEIFRSVLVEAVKGRTLKRALRLRLVSQKFSAEVMDAVCTQKLLDGCETYIKDCPIAKFYVTRRILGEMSTGFPLINHIRRIAATLASQEPGSFRHYVKKLCAFLSNQLWMPHFFMTTTTRDLESQFRNDLLIAAVAMEKEELVAKLLDSLNDQPGFLFKVHHALLAAVDTRNHGMLDLLFENVKNPRFMLEGRVQVFGRAARKGQKETIMHMLEKWPPPNNSGTNEAVRLFRFALQTPSIEIFNMILAASQKYHLGMKVPHDVFELLLRVSVREGWLQMTLHLISIGAPLARTLHAPKRYDIDIIKPCEEGHTETIRLFLDYGASFPEKAIIAAAKRGRAKIIDLFHDRGIRSDHAMSAAAQTGHLSVVNLLVEKGEDVNAGFTPPIVFAVQQEDTAMFNYLIEKGAVLDTPATGGEAVTRAMAEGLESMLVLLREHGVALSEGRGVKEADSKASPSHNSKCLGGCVLL